MLTAIDQAAPGIHAVTAESSSDQYVSLVDDHTIETGHLYYRKTGSGPEMALHIDKPAAKVFVYRDNTGWMYIPAARQVQKFDLSKNRSLVEQFLLLGLGGGGHALLKSFHVAIAGDAELDGIPTVELTLTPLRPDLARNITQIQLWYNRSTWVAVQQKFLQPGGDYRLLHYSHMQINGRISDHFFDTKFPGATVISPHP